MASTNKTTHYELSQYVGSDKPTYLTDYNNDMENIDTGIYNAQTKADSAYALAETAEGKADNATLTANSALTNAGTANTNIGAMANLTTTDKSSLVGAINEVNYNVGLFNLSVFETPTVTPAFGTTGTNTLSVATNANGSLSKVYGTIQLNDVSGGGTRALGISMTSSLRPSANITINNAGIVRILNTNGDVSVIKDFDITIATNGTITFETNVFNDTLSARFMIFPCLYFIKDFGDAPTPE